LASLAILPNTSAIKRRDMTQQSGQVSITRPHRQGAIERVLVRLDQDAGNHIGDRGFALAMDG